MLPRSKDQTEKLRQLETLINAGKIEGSKALNMSRDHVDKALNASEANYRSFKR